MPEPTTTPQVWYFMIKTALTTFALLGAIAAADNAKADPYRWCAQYGGRDGPSNCYFLTLGQCQATISGNGGYCRPNPFFTGPEERPPQRRHISRS
jgi:hypothetical protein